MNGSDRDASVVTAVLAGGLPVRVQLAEPPGGMASVGLTDHLNLDEALDSVAHIGSAVVDRLRAARPTRATVELRLGFAVEAGKLTALWVNGKADASLTVTLEWSEPPAGEAKDG